MIDNSSKRLRKALGLPLVFNDPRVELAFLRQYRWTGVRFARVAFSLGAVLALLFFVLLIAVPDDEVPTNPRQGVRLALSISMSLVVFIVHFRPRFVVEHYILVIGGQLLLTCLAVGVMSLLPTDAIEPRSGRWAVAMCLACWLGYGFTRLPVVAVIIPCVIGSALILAGAHTYGDDYVRALWAYLITANISGWMMSCAIERRERTLFRKSRQLTQATRALERMARQAAKADAAKTSVMAAVSHDLRQPISSLSLYIQLLQSRNAEVAAAGLNGLLQKAGACVEVLSSNLGRLAELSGLQEDRTPIELRQVDLREVLERLEHVYAVEAQRRQVRLRVRMPPIGKFLVRSNEGRLWDVLSNLVGNALKFGSPNRAPWVLVRARRVGDSVTVLVCDNGVGIDQADHERVFEEHYQVDNAERNRERGYGLGLSIVREMIDRLPGHSMRLRSARDAGACFAVYMHRVPLRDVGSSIVGGEIDRAGAGRSSSSPMGDTPPLLAADALAVSELSSHYACLSLQEGERALAGAYMLLVEDDASMREALGLMLERWGALVEAVAQASEALHCIEHGERLFDVVISDYRLPGHFDGLRLIGEARRLLGEPIPAVLISAELNMQELRKQAPDDVVVLPKPLDTRVLRGVLIALTRRSLGRQEVEAASQ